MFNLIIIILVYTEFIFASINNCRNKPYSTANYQGNHTTNNDTSKKCVLATYHHKHRHSQDHKDDARQ
uniref:Secreted protein n=1 Tax=Ditylenchus dipsaci TaxID=166011 RepID=A0A915ERT3_9BILA